MDYPIEVKLVSKNGYHYPQEARAAYGRYSRDNYIVHWWGAPGSVGDHDQTVAYITKTAAAGTMSVNYVVSNTKITMLVDPVNVSWGAQDGNPTGINVEHEPTLNDEGYKRAGWLKWKLEQQFGKQLGMKKHSDYFSTACPGSIDVNRIEAECDKLRKGDSMSKESLTREEVIVTHQLAYFQDPPQSTIDYYTGKDLSTMLTDFKSSDPRKEVEKQYAAGANTTPPEVTPLKPGVYEVKA